MLTEIKNVRQERHGGRRRWFESEGFDLVIWFDDAQAVTGFQICYDFGRGEHALTWRAEGGFVHSAVDEGDASPLKNESPVLAPAGSVPWAAMQAAFEARCGNLEPDLQRLVREKLAADKSSGARG